ncbi:V-type ATP synthase subunit K [Thermoclostridium stercorarium subsp. stercorarium DSM 8532]|jgi:V/A-type H+-transporting ATPase subunit K|uniref:V-type ATP synthase subunit K n=2 Tax=Thermoclostridium stercorarium TaxID=1510 RepID=L7VP88_THES1|nr:V-type ATP synthase subunit K [Thermoclostridium stercorarium]AGC67368.1 V-type ATP synthase subunit K [Thermoclostridium stercorarium subsp. stercorarium DSM 8532]AGI38429.1 ATP synthase subunit C [Thermoclostridium stercorarium subsp. stercorarium DSM 8532]ANW97862.1 permease [Thermoclostridium stercorarium subsp. thermolacticum DSM 2910]UZQ85960.1 V-type ATP synthase subunit K [Thermoclostridium stercorarium]
MLENILTGQFFAYLGAAVAFLVAGLGSSKGVGLAGQTGAGVLSEDPSKFGSVMLLEALPSTQAIYGFVIAFLIIGNVNESMTLQQGLSLFIAGLPVGIVGLVSAIFQGKVAAAGIQMISKRPEGLGSAITLALMVEMFAILSLIVSILMIR